MPTKARPNPCRAVFVLAATAAFALPSTAHAIIIRHDVDDAQYVVDDADYPALVDLFEPGDCIGTLVHPSFLLTVAHCAVDLRVGQSLSVAGTTHAVDAVILHPQWDDFDADDIALVRLGRPVQGVDPLPLYRGADEMGAEVTLVGRGVTATGLEGEAGGDSDGQLRRATNIVTAVDEQFIEVRFDDLGAPSITDFEGVGAAGDSGCPVFVDVDGTPQIAGLNSWGDGDGDIGIGQYGALDYQTRVSQFADWVDATIAEPPEVPGDDTGETSAADTSTDDDDGGSVDDTAGAEDDTGEQPDDASTTGQDATAASAGGTEGHDTDAPGADDPDQGCTGCSTARTPPWGLGLFALVVLRRRRR